VLSNSPSPGSATGCPKTNNTPLCQKPRAFRSSEVTAAGNTLQTSRIAVHFAYGQRGHAYTFCDTSFAPADDTIVCIVAALEAEP